MIDGQQAQDVQIPRVQLAGHRLIVLVIGIPVPDDVHAVCREEGDAAGDRVAIQVDQRRGDRGGVGGEQPAQARVVRREQAPVVAFVHWRGKKVRLLELGAWVT